MTDRYRIICADALDAMREMADGSVDAIVTDPPYGLGFPYRTYDDTRENLRFLIARFMPEALRIARDRVVVLCGPTQISLYPEPDWVSAVLWNTTGSFGKYGYNQWAPVLLYGKDRPGFGSVEGMLKSDAIMISGGASVGFRRSEIEKKHTCPKPIGIMRGIVKRYTNPGNVVLDPFCGLGTTGVAAIECGRTFIGIEMEFEWAQAAAERIGATTVDWASPEPRARIAHAAPEPADLFDWARGEDRH